MIRNCSDVAATDISNTTYTITVPIFVFVSTINRGDSEKTFGDNRSRVVSNRLLRICARVPGARDRSVCNLSEAKHDKKSRAFTRTYPDKNKHPCMQKHPRKR